MDALLETWRAAQLSARPRSGWARAIRESLGMSAAAFARRLGMSPVGVRKLESAEALDVITLASLRKLAQALDCELHYALVPRTSYARLIADLLAMRLGRPRLTWGGGDATMTKVGPLMYQYLTALRAADQGQLSDLIAFARS